MEARSEEEMAVGGESKALSEQASNVGSSSGRLGAAVQRAMAIRERQSSQVVEGIGAIRQIVLYQCSSLHHSRPSACSQCGGPLDMSLLLDYRTHGEMVAVSGRKTQSMRYARISNDGYCDTDCTFLGSGRMAAEDPNDKTGLICCKASESESTEAEEETAVGVDSPSVLSVEKQRICEACRSVRVLSFQCQRMNDGVRAAAPQQRRKGFVRRLCSKLLRLHRKPPAAAIF